MPVVYYLDFTSHIPQRLAPDRNELIRFLNQEVRLPKGGNILIQDKPGVFKVKILDAVKGATLENKVVNYYLPDDTNGKRPIKLKFEKRESENYVKLRYVTITNLHNSNLGDHITNEILNDFFRKFGDIINPVSDVFTAEEEVWMLDKKRLFMDLNKGTDIPRINPFEMKVGSETIRGQIRVTYREQPYLCRRCGTEHSTNCPKWEEERKREALIKNLKEKDTKTLFVGDSNLKLVNSDAILADVVSSSGAKVGHITNILNTEKLENYENIVVLAGINNIPSAQTTFEDSSVFEQTKKEIDQLSDTLEPHVKLGRKVVIVKIPDAPHCRQSQKAVQLRNRVNKQFDSAAKSLNSKCPRNSTPVHVFAWDHSSEEDFTSIKGVSEKMTADLVGEIDSLLKNKLRATYLVGAKHTAQAYRKVTPVYPLGCKRCTMLYHSEGDCKVDFKKKTRNLSNKDEHESLAKKNSGS